MLNKPRKLFLMLTIAVFLVPAFANASIILNEAGVFMGVDAEAFTFPVFAGDYKATIFDDSPDWMNGFQFLTLSIFDGLSEVAHGNADGDFIFTASMPGTWTAIVVGLPLIDSNPSTLDWGTYLAQIESVSAVPIPATLVLFGSGLVSLIGLKRRMR